MTKIVDNVSATIVRFLFGLPFVIIFVVFLVFFIDMPVPQTNSLFFCWILLGSFSQIFAQLLMIKLFSIRNFAAANAYVRTEPVMAIIFGIVFLDEYLSLIGNIAVIMAVLGVILITFGKKNNALESVKLLSFKDIQIGIMSASLFAVAAVSFRAASLSLTGTEFLMQAAWSLLWATALQSIAMVAWISYRAPAQFGILFSSWRLTVLTGFISAVTSVGWFSAMTLQTAAAVKALAQIEIIFSILTSIFILRENVTIKEIIGCIIIGSAIFLVIFSVN